jgi:hypothetical protein
MSDSPIKVRLLEIKSIRKQMRGPKSQIVH